MPLTASQKAALKAAINADPVMSALPNSNDGAYEIAALLNAEAVPAYSVWKTNASTQDVFDAIDWSKYTPVDAPDGTATYTNRLLAVQTKQMNLQNMLVGRETFNASKANIRAGIRDAVIQLPAGTGGAMVTAAGANGNNALNTMTRNARLVEKILSTGLATTGGVTAGIMGYEGAISPDDVVAARSA